MVQGTGCYLIAKYCANAEVEASSLTVRLSDSWLCLHWGSPEGEKQQERMKGMKGQAAAYHTRKVPHSIATSSDPVRSCQILSECTLARALPLPHPAGFGPGPARAVARINGFTQSIGRFKSILPGEALVLGQSEIAVNNGLVRITKDIIARVQFLASPPTPLLRTSTRSGALKGWDRCSVSSSTVRRQSRQRLI